MAARVSGEALAVCAWALDAWFRISGTATTDARAVLFPIAIARFVSGGNRETHGLRQDHVTEGRQKREARRPRGFPLTLVDGEDAGPEDLLAERRENEAEAEPGREEARELDVDVG